MASKDFAIQQGPSVATKTTTVGLGEITLGLFDTAIGLGKAAGEAALFNAYKQNDPFPPPITTQGQSSSGEGFSLAGISGTQLLIGAGVAGLLWVLMK